MLRRWIERGPFVREIVRREHALERGMEIVCAPIVIIKVHYGLVKTS